MKNHPIYTARRTLHTGADLLTDKQKDRLAALFTDAAHVEVEEPGTSTNAMIAAYRAVDRRCGRELMVEVIDSVGFTSDANSVSDGVSPTLSERVTPRRGRAHLE